MKNVSLILFLALSSFSVFGQNHFLGIKGGPNRTSISSKYNKQYLKSRQGFLGGITYENYFTTEISAGIDLIYNQRGFKEEFPVFNELGRLSTETIKLDFAYNYLSVPIKLGYRYGEKFYGFLYLGAIPSLLVQSEITGPEIDNNGKVIGTRTVNNYKDVNKFDLAGLGELGIGFHVNSQIDLFSSFHYQQSITPINESSIFAKSANLHKGMGLVLGLKYSLKTE